MPKKKEKKVPTVEVKESKVTEEQRQKNLEAAIETLNSIVCVRIAPSPIHGVGVFAIQDLKKGDRLQLDAMWQGFDVPYSMFDRLLPEVRQLILERWPKVVEGSHFIYPDTRMSVYLNHSEDPNYDPREDKLLRDVRKGEELTEDYRLIPNWEKSFPFLAGGTA